MGNWINGLVDEWINGRENVLRAASFKADPQG
jgi:hypothetical protein